MLHHDLAPRAGAATWSVLAAVLAACGAANGPAAGGVPALANPNDNRRPAGTVRADGAVELRLDARLASWRPDADVDTTVTVLAFGVAGGPASIPGPLLRVREGTEVRITVANTLTGPVRIGPPPPGARSAGPADPMAGPRLVVHGLRAGTVEDDTLHVGPGGVREVRFRATRPGTFVYWGSLSAGTFAARTGRDGQLTGVIVVDPAGTDPDPAERIFVITVLDILPDSTGPAPHDDVFELAINGRSWPHTEPFEHAVGDTVRWRWVNGSDTPHPMHLHGFHYRVRARGDGRGDVVLAPDAAPLAVTEVVNPGASFRMEWVPTRVGRWLMHCHIVGHIAPFPERDAEARQHDEHDLARHPREGMAGLVLGITVTDPRGEAADPRPVRRLRLEAREGPSSGRGLAPRGFVLSGGRAAPDTVAVPGPPLVLRRGEPAAITVVNHLPEATTIHWHGMELASVYDGVAGWSGVGTRLAPLIAPGDSFTVQMTPPRAGTFIYHTHMDESDQLRRGMYGPLLVLEPGAELDAARDHVFTIGFAVDGDSTGPAINGSARPDAVVLRAGVPHRLRLINISADETVEVTLEAASAAARWLPLAADGADLPAAWRTEGPARIRLGVGETYDFGWTPQRAGDAALVVRWDIETASGPVVLRQPLRVR